MFIIPRILVALSFVLMSDRGHFWSADDVGNETEEFINGAESAACFDDFKDQKVLVLVHGYNNTAQEALKTYETIRGYIEKLNLYDTIIGYLWPGCDESFEYFCAEKNTKKLAKRMQGHLQTLSQNSSFLDILAHSMGNRLILEALQQSTQKNILIRNFYSLAPAVKVKDIEINGPFYLSVLQCQNMFVFHSDRDDVLKYDFFLAERSRALGYKGLGSPQREPQNVQFIDCTEFVDGHSGYFTAGMLYNFFKNQQEKQTIDAMNVKLLVNGMVKPLLKEAIQK